MGGLFFGYVVLLYYFYILKQNEMNLKEIDSELLKEELLNRGYIRVFWHKEDIISTAKNYDYELTDDEVEEVRYHIEQGFDANVGVNWDVIAEYIRIVKEK